MRIVQTEVVIEASPEVVFHHLTDPTALGAWIARGGALSDLVEGGELRWTFANGAVMSGRYVEVAPPHRLVFTYGWLDNLMGVPPGSTLVEIDLDPHAQGTRLRLRHSVVPDDAGEAHQQGWDHFLALLAVHARKGPRQQSDAARDDHSNLMGDG